MSDDCDTLQIDLKNCRFLPINVLEKVVDKANTRALRKFTSKMKCTRNLVQLQYEALNYRQCLGNKTAWRIKFSLALSKAVLSQDWDKLLCLLKASPIWEHYNPGSSYHFIDNYLKALVILLMYHPSAQAQGLMDEFLHMVLSCRSDKDKRAFMKILTSIPDKLVARNGFRKLEKLTD